MRARTSMFRPGVRRLAVALPLAGIALTAPASAQWWGRAALEVRMFPESGASPAQSQLSGSFLLNPHFVQRFGPDRSLVFEAFARVDEQDGSRTHADVRQLYFEWVAGSLELRLGVRRVFWGVTESQHLVDIINQTDLVEDPDGEAKLGQPMVNLAFIRSWGTIDLFVMPGSRERTFPGARGRLRPELPIDADLTTWESAAGRWHVDVAARWSRQLGAWDLGVSHYRGTNRDPDFLPAMTAAGSPVLAPRYEQIHQTGIDVQLTTGGWLGKLEAIRRSSHRERFAAFTAGFEYTFGTVFGSGADLGVLAEYSWDERGRLATTGFDDDVFVGARLALNDVQSTQLLVGAIIDRGGSGTIFRIEGSRRFREKWTFDIRGLAFAGIAERQPAFSLRRDHYFEIGVSRYF